MKTFYRHAIVGTRSRGIRLTSVIVADGAPRKFCSYAICQTPPPADIRADHEAKARASFAKKWWLKSKS